MNEFGFTDNFDKRYLSGWRYILYLSGACELKFVRKILKGRWEAWWIEPCLSYVWHPVYCESSGEKKRGHAQCGTQYTSLKNIR